MTGTPVCDSAATLWRDFSHRAFSEEGAGVSAEALASEGVAVEEAKSWVSYLMPEGGRESL